MAFPYGPARDNHGWTRMDTDQEGTTKHTKGTKTILRPMAFPNRSARDNHGWTRIDTDEAVPM